MPSIVALYFLRCVSLLGIYCFSNSTHFIHCSSSFIFSVMRCISELTRPSAIFFSLFSSSFVPSSYNFCTTLILLLILLLNLMTSRIFLVIASGILASCRQNLAILLTSSVRNIVGPFVNVCASPVTICIVDL